MIAHDEHVRIIPLPGTCELTESVLKKQIIIDFLPFFSPPSLIIAVVVDYFEDLLPGVVDITEIPPEVAVLSYRFIVAA